ncbi:uncharacterized protein [Elaeis guineensis]|uniref:uncharacterized protein isoform X2 n=1 Tax=Elaeis guineensis var. tenera TaxID=51953 RepID=UPI003C6CF667
MTCIKRWTVSHTKHMKQKRKICQDVVLELSGSGNENAQVTLYDDSDTLIDRRFVKKDEVVECGRMLTMETHLVDVGDLEADHGHVTKLDVSGRDKKLNEVAKYRDKRIKDILDSRLQRNIQLRY